MRFAIDQNNDGEFHPVLVGAASGQG